MFSLPFSLLCLSNVFLSSLSLLALFEGIYFAPLPNRFFSPSFLSLQSSIACCLSKSHFFISLLMFLFIRFLHHIQSHLPPGSVFPPLFTFSLCTICVCVTQALHLMTVVSYCVDPVTALKMRNLFSCAFIVDHTSRSHEGVPLVS